jgi:galactitol-specific phosphotransferase system IIC component
MNTESTYSRLLFLSAVITSLMCALSVIDGPVDSLSVSEFMMMKVEDREISIGGGRDVLVGIKKKQ